MKCKENARRSRNPPLLCSAALLLTHVFVGTPAWTAGAADPPSAERPVTTQAVREGPVPAAEETVAKPRGRLRDRFSEFSYTDELPPELTIEAFESALETQFYGTFVFYSKLPQNKRLQIYQGYRKEQHIASIRASTLELLR